MFAAARLRFPKLFVTALLLSTVACGRDSTAPPAAVKLAFTTPPATSVAGRVFSPAVVVAVEDANGAVTTDASVNVSITISANGLVAGTATVQSVHGIATFPDLRVNTAGVGYTLTASAPNLQDAISSPFDIAPGPAAKLAFLVQPVNVVANTFMPTFTVAVQDVFGNTVQAATAAVSVAMTTNGAAQAAGTTTVPTVSGVALFSNVSVTSPGTALTLRAMSGNLIPAVSSVFDVTVGPASKLVFSAQPVAARPGQVMNDVMVSVTDASGNLITSAGSPITLQIGNNPSGGTLAGTTARAAQGGQAVFTGLSINNLGAGYTLLASSPNLLTATSTPFDIRNALNFASVTSGYFHTCGLTTTNVTYCWGFNGSTELGNLTPDRSTVPLQISGSNAFVRVSAGRDHNCGTTAGAVAYCWGANNVGQLGPSVAGQNTPTPTAVSTQLSFAAVDAGYSHTCGVTPAGAAYCWGSNNSGELGNQPSFVTSTPSPVAGGFTFTSVSTGRFFTCGIRTGGAAYCWGVNSEGELGTGDQTFRLVPTAVTGGLSFTAISAGGFHACALTSAGAAYCWGSNVFGELGNNSTVTSNAPVAVAGGLTFATISAGNRHTCGVTTSGVAYCWGDNLEGKLGIGSTTNSSSPHVVSGGLTFRSVSAGRFHTCGVTTAGLAYCWGSNSVGLLGDGTTNDAFVPVAVQ